MSSKTLFDFYLILCSAYCLEYCVDFDAEAETYRGMLVLKGHISYLEELRIKLGIE